MDERAFDGLWSTQPDKAQVLTIAGRQVEAPRRQRSFGVSYAFSRQVALAAPMGDEPLVQRLADALAELRRASGATGAARANSLLNFYDSARGHYIGPHSDSEDVLVAGAPIFSVSWGQARRFRLTPRREGSGVELQLRHGDLLAMGGRCQSTHKHELRKPTKAESTAGGPFGTRRINATFRFFKEPHAAGREATSGGRAARGGHQSEAPCRPAVVKRQREVDGWARAPPSTCARR